jgi:catabolite regulation protein CreA
MKRLGLVLGAGALVIVVLFALWIISRPERGTTGSVNTKFRLLGPDDKIVVDGFDDPKVEGVACHISRAQTGGMKATDPANGTPAQRLSRQRFSALTQTGRTGPKQHVTGKFLRAKLYTECWI